MTSVPDEELIDAVVARRDRRSFDELYRRHADRHYRFLLKLTAGERELADDLFQDTWLIAFTRLSRFEARSRFFTWLAGISLNLARAFWRKKGREEELPELEGTDGSGTEAALDAEAILANLAPGYREVLVLHSEGYTHEEIGNILSISDGTSKSQLARARQAAERLIKGKKA